MAFTAAIEIDPNQALAYVGRGDAYVASGETEENLTAAQVDYEKAVELDESLETAYLGLVDIYIWRGEHEKALEILQRGYEATGSQELLEKIEALDLDEAISSEPQEFPSMNERLDISDITYTYEDNADLPPGSEGAVGLMMLHGVVNGPDNVCSIGVWMCQKEPFLQEQIDRGAAEVASA